MKIKDVYLDKATEQNWIDELMPKFDLLFFTSEHQSLIAELGKDVISMPRREFFDNSSLYTVDILNSYQLWGLSKQAETVCIVHPSILPQLNKDIRNFIFQIQKELNRGLIFEWSFFHDLIENVESSTLRDQLLQEFLPYRFEYETSSLLALQSHLWSELPFTFKQTFFEKLALKFIDDDLVEVGQVNTFKNEYPHISKYFNTFSGLNGPNCLAATLAAVSETSNDPKWIITMWLYQEGFMNGLKTNGYIMVNDTIEQLKPKDVMVWKNDNNIIQHASFYLGEGYFFNKNGQTFLNPWQIVSKETLLKNWGEQRIELYRRSSTS